MEDRTKNRILTGLKARGPQKAADLADHLKVTPVAIRQHLDQLLADGLLEYVDVRSGRGRPRRTWSLSEKGHARFPDNSSGLLLDMIQSVKSLYGSEGLDRLIDHRKEQTLLHYRDAIGGEKTLEGKLGKLVELRNQEGYMAAMSGEPDGCWLLIENHCSICAAATACQGFCRSEQEIFQEILGEDCSIVRLEHRIAGARRCVYRISENDPISRVA
ncbi:MAG: metalloregulator ArsR/SmtB family transcription factor [Stappiaceae bacterium]